MAKVLCEFDADGREILDNTPVEMPLNYKEPPSIEQMIRQAIRVEMSQQAAAQGMESFEEADDFAVDDEDEFVSPYQLSEMQEEIPLSVRQEVSGNGQGDKSVRSGTQAVDTVGGASSGVVGASAGKAAGNPGDGGGVSASGGGLPQIAK